MLMFYSLEEQHINYNTMNNKLKSLVYLICFIIASVVYTYSTEASSESQIVENTFAQEADLILESH